MQVREPAERPHTHAHAGALRGGRRGACPAGGGTRHQLAHPPQRYEWKYGCAHSYCKHSMGILLAYSGVQSIMYDQGNGKRGRKGGGHEGRMRAYMHMCVLHAQWRYTQGSAPTAPTCWAWPSPRVGRLAYWLVGWLVVLPVGLLVGAPKEQLLQLWAQQLPARSHCYAAGGPRRQRGPGQLVDH